MALHPRYVRLVDGEPMGKQMRCKTIQFNCKFKWKFCQICL